METDVLVLGAGPAGACAARFLSEKGINVILIDENKREDIGKKVCGDGMRTIGFEHAKLFPPPENITKQYISKGTVISSDKKTKISINVGKRDGYCIDRCAFGKALIEKAEQSGAKTLFEHKAEDLIWKDNKIIGAIVNGKEIHAKCVIAATGMSAFRFKTPSADSLKKYDIYVCYRERILIDKTENIDSQEILFFFNQDIAPGGYIWYFPMGMQGNKLLVNFGLGVNGENTILKETPLKNLLDIFKQQNSELFKGYEIWNNDSFNSRGGIVPIRYVLESLADIKDNEPTGLLYAGDIGSTVDPIHGGGIRSSIDAANDLVEPVKEFIETKDYNKLWQYNLNYLKNFGAKKQSTEYICSLAMNESTNTQLDLVLKNVINKTNIENLVSGKGLVFEFPKIFFRIFKLGLSGLEGKKAAKRLMFAYRYSKRIQAIYKQYPETPIGLDEWKIKLHNLLNDYINKIHRV